MLFDSHHDYPFVYSYVNGTCVDFSECSSDFGGFLYFPKTGKVLKDHFINGGHTIYETYEIKDHVLTKKDTYLYSNGDDYKDYDKEAFVKHTDEYYFEGETKYDWGYLTDCFEK